MSPFLHSDRNYRNWIYLRQYQIYLNTKQSNHHFHRSSAISSIIKQLPTTMLKLAEDRETGGLFNNWFGKKSKYSLEFRLTTRIFATYVLHQVNLFIEIEWSYWCFNWITMWHFDCSQLLDLNAEISRSTRTDRCGQTARGITWQVKLEKQWITSGP